MVLIARIASVLLKLKLLVINIILIPQLLNVLF